MDDLVSIIMPSYNTGKYIAQAIRSVLCQTYTNWELIIIDDCSTDNTDSVLITFNDKRIKCKKNSINVGAAESRNIALREAKGDWIAFLDSDDLWMQEKLEKQINFMKMNCYYFSYTCYSEIDELSMLTGVMVSGPKRITKIGMFNYCWPGCLTVMYSAYRIGLIQIENIQKNNDYAIWLKVCRKADCYLLNENLARYRKRSGSISNKNFWKLIRWHYALFHIAEKENALSSILNTFRNLGFGVWKKLIYVNKTGVK